MLLLPHVVAIPTLPQQASLEERQKRQLQLRAATARRHPKTTKGAAAPFVTPEDSSQRMVLTNFFGLTVLPW